MKIISDFRKDIQNPKPKPGSYEWWYFDAVSDNGYSLVVIFYEGNPFSRKYAESVLNKRGRTADEFPALSISVYKNGKPVYYGFEEFLPDMAEFSPKYPKGRAGDSFFIGKNQQKKVEYSIQLNQSLPTGDSISGSLTFSSPEFRFSDGDNRVASTEHTWNLIQPMCRVTGNLRIAGRFSETIHFRGSGYHDHNFGAGPLKDTFDEWYWGRYHLDDSVLVYYLIRKNSEWEKKAWMIDNQGKAEDQIAIRLLEKSPNIFGLTSSRKIEFKGSAFSAFLQKDTILDNGPFYQRFKGRMMLITADELKQTTGISEYLKPSRIYNKLFWPLVNMRIQYPGESHWVQKNPTLYRWTW